MAESVECAECGTRYDSQQHPFCPRCGSTRKGAPVPRAVASSRRRSPRRRRVQVGGVILVTLGGYALLNFLFLAATAPTALEDLAPRLAGQPGGRLEVVVLDGGQPVDDVALRLLHPTTGADLDANRTGPDGSATLDASASAYARIQATVGNATWNRTAVALPAGLGGQPRVVIDVASDMRDAAWRPDRSLVVALRILSALVAVLAAVVVLGGVMAIRLRNRGAAITGAALAAAPPLALTLVGAGPGAWLLLLPTGLALAFIVAGRREFARPARHPDDGPPRPPEQGGAAGPDSRAQQPPGHQDGSDERPGGQERPGDEGRP